MYTPLEELIKIIKENNVSGETDVVEKAYNYAVLKHEGQLRKSGEEYVNHPIAVSKIIAEMGLDTSSIAAALLHDVVEDTDCTDTEIQEQFGETIALLVCGVTKLGKVPYTSKEEQQVENLRKNLVDQSYLTKLQESYRRSKETALKTNSYWVTMAGRAALFFI